ncbi:MAG: ferritin-like domain-containing protein [Candidatus Omnitrophica bacterium]|nr:ferritin-like domain-containing protein [Candidatus Omnitrophota bacterium]
MSKETLIKGLNDDLAAELGTIIRYTYQAGKSFGLAGAGLREILQREVQDELGHAAFLTDVIIDLGGEPVTVPKKFEKPDDLKGMLELDLKMEMDDIAQYEKRAKQAEELGEVELKVKLEEMAADEAGHAREIRRLLKGL